MEYYQKIVTPCLTPFMIDLKKKKLGFVRRKQQFMLADNTHTRNLTPEAELKHQQ